MKKIILYIGIGIMGTLVLAILLLGAIGLWDYSIDTCPKEKLWYSEQGVLYCNRNDNSSGQLYPGWKQSE